MAKKKVAKKKATSREAPPTDTDRRLAEAEARAKVAENAAAKANAELANAQGMKIPNVKKKDTKVRRPDEIMAEDLASAQGIETENLSDKQTVAIEREIRRYVKRGYLHIANVRKEVPKGYKEGIPEADKARANHLLRMIGRVDADGEPILEWDESIIVPGF